MNWLLEKLMDLLYEYYNKDLNKEIEKLKSEIVEKDSDIQTNEAEIISLNDTIISDRQLYLQKEQQYLAEIAGLNDNAEKPEWLVNHMIYKPKRRFISKTKDYHRQFAKPQYAFDKSTILYELLNKNKLLDVEKTLENMAKIQKIITNSIIYEHDKEDNWRPISDILMFGFGDCDDSGGVAITSAIGMAGWKADETFCWCGYYYPKGKDVEPKNRFGHAWNITKYNGKWYVLEGTNPKAKPELWEKVKNKYEGVWGGCNWKFEGMIAGNKKYL